MLYSCSPLRAGIKLNGIDPQGFADPPGAAHVRRSGRGSALLMTTGGQHCCYHDGHGHDMHVLPSTGSEGKLQQGADHSQHGVRLPGLLADKLENLPD